MNKVQAHCQILRDLLKKNERITLSQAMNVLSVSQSSARRLFDMLEEQGDAIRVHGAVVRVQRREYSYEELENRSQTAKELIAACAASLVSPGEVIYLDSGTTLAAMASALAERIRTEGLEIKVFTNSLVNLGILSPVTEVDLVGGRYRANRKDTSGYMAEAMIKSLHFDRAFLGADGCAAGTGFTAGDFSTARLNEMVLSSAGYSAVLADREKIDVSAVVSYTGSCMPDELITDSEVSSSTSEYLTEAGVKVTVAGSETV